MARLPGQKLGLGKLFGRVGGKLAAKHGDEVASALARYGQEVKSTVVCRWLKIACFTPDTPVHTPQGPRRIDQIDPGQEVLAYDFAHGRWVPRRVLKRHDNLYLGPLFTIITSQGQVTTTANHPFWVVEGLELEERPPCKKLAPDEDQGLSLPGRWVASQHLQAGDLLYTADGQTVRIEEIRQHLVDREPICNLTVAENPNFSVGPAGLLVHNTSGCEEAAEFGGKLRFDHTTRSWVSSAGLVYGQGSIHGNRVKHVLSHLVADPSKPRHTVFSIERTKLLGLIDEAWKKRGSPIRRARRDVYEISMLKPIGSRGESWIRIVVEARTNKLVTAYPISR